MRFQKYRLIGLLVELIIVKFNHSVCIYKYFHHLELFYIVTSGVKIFTNPDRKHCSVVPSAKFG